MKPVMKRPPQTVVCEDLGKCPFCGAAISANVEHGAVMHGLPMCHEFESKDPYEYIKACNVKKANELGVGLS